MANSIKLLSKTTISAMSLLWLLLNVLGIPVIVLSDMTEGYRTLKRNNGTLLGECQGNCHRGSPCAAPYKCARYHQNELVQSGYDRQFAYCDSSDVNKKKNNYFCYDQYKASKKPCPSGITMQNSSGRCNPADWPVDGSCLVTPLDPFYCCHVGIDIYNSTHSICNKYQTCPGYASCSCVRIRKNQYMIECASSTECGCDPLICL